MSQTPTRSGSTLVAAGIFLSRIAGIVRTIALAVVLGGDKAATDAFGFAMRIPNLMQNLLGEGSLSASFIPVYARLVEEGDEGRASALAGAVLSLLALITAAIVIILVALARPLVWLLTSWESDPARYELTIQLFRITTVGIGFLVVSAWCLGVLNSHRSFFLSYAAPVLWNVTQIAVLALVAILTLTTTSGIVALAWAVVVGGLLQPLVQIPRVRRFTPSLRLSLQRTPLVRDVLSRFTPAVGARGVVQISSFIDTVFLGMLAGGAVSAYVYALPLYVTPISLFGFSVAAAELAEMSRQSDRIETLAARITPALRKTVLPAGFITAAYLAAGPIWADALYGWPSRLLNRGLTDRPSVLIVGYLLVAMALGLPAAITARVTQNTLYSLGDVTGPARIAVARVVVSVVASLVLMLQLDWLAFEATSVVEFGSFPHWPPWERIPEARRSDDAFTHLGVTGIGLGSALASWTEWVLLRLRLRQHLGAMERRTLTSGWGRQVFVAAAGAWGAMVMAAMVPVPAPLDAVLVLLIGLIIYGSLLWIQGVRPPGRLTSKP